MKKLLVLLFMAATAVQVLANAAPFPPGDRSELPNPADWLAMRGERVHVTITGATSSVDARFHFEAVRGSRLNDFTLRMGFPQLRDQQPMEGFQVRQVVYPLGVPGGTLEAAYVSPVGPVPPSAETLPALRWLTWPVPLPARPRGEMRNAADVEVTYTQALTPIPGQRLASSHAGRDKPRYLFRYVLRSGTPWAKRIGASEVVVDLLDAKLISASPNGWTRVGNRLKWTWTDWEPAQDVVVSVRADR